MQKQYHNKGCYHFQLHPGCGLAIPAFNVNAHHVDENCLPQTWHVCNKNVSQVQRNSCSTPSRPESLATDAIAPQQALQGLSVKTAGLGSMGDISLMLAEHGC